MLFVLLSSWSNQKEELEQKRRRLQEERKNQREKSAEAKRQLIESKKENARLLKSFKTQSLEKAKDSRDSDLHEIAQNSKRISQDDKRKRSISRENSQVFNRASGITYMNGMELVVLWGTGG